jgi:hypothetical protein
MLLDLIYIYIYTCMVTYVVLYVYIWSHVGIHVCAYVCVVYTWLHTYIYRDTWRKRRAPDFLEIHGCVQKRRKIQNKGSTHSVLLYVLIIITIIRGELQWVQCYPGSCERALGVMRAWAWAWAWTHGILLYVLIIITIIRGGPTVFCSTLLAQLNSNCLMYLLIVFWLCIHTYTCAST